METYQLLYLFRTFIHLSSNNKRQETQQQAAHRHLNNVSSSISSEDKGKEGDTGKDKETVKVN
jgi:hypothetical protein